MKISIVTISFNQSQYINETILSVLKQNYNNTEYIVVDPGSTDGSREIIYSYQNKIDKIIFEPDLGPADGLNKGFAEATGDIYGFLNSDDLLEENALCRVAHYFSTHQNIDVVSAHSRIIDCKNVHIRKFYSDRFSLKMAAYGASILCQPSTFFRSNIFNKVGGFNVQNRSNWDGEFFIDMALNGAQFALINEFLSMYRVHDQGITGSGKMHKLHQEHRQRMFKKIMGRDFSQLDYFVEFCSKYTRKFFNPFDTLERILHGPVYRATI